MKKKLAIILGAFSIGNRPLDMNLNNLFESPRGLTGTDLSFVMLCKTMHDLGHEVHFFTIHAQSDNHPQLWEGCHVYNFEDRFQIVDESFDAIISINAPDDLRGMTDKPLRICWQYLNDFYYCQEGFDDFVDMWLGVASRQVERLKTLSPSPQKWKILALGCNPERYDHSKRVHGRMVYCSSPDRGLHWALQVFPEIKKAVPEATLKIFYHFPKTYPLDIEYNSSKHPYEKELSNRLRYCLNAMEKMKDMGVEHVGSVSVNEMNKQLSEASLLLYPCDTVLFSEGFSLSIMSAAASGTAIPAISSVDGLGDIYKDSGCIMVHAPIGKHLQEYTEKVIRALKDEDYANDIRAKCLEFAKQYSWPDIGKKLEKMIQEHPKTIERNKIQSLNNKTELELSVIVPTSKHGGLDILFAGLKSQTVKNFELVLVDDLYEYRKDIVASKICEYDFIIKHIPPTKNLFPISNKCDAINTGLMHASAKIILLLEDYTYLPEKCVEKHINFHIACPSDNIGIMGTYEYQDLPKLNIDYKYQDSDLYVEDLKQNKLNHLMWSIFDQNGFQFAINNEIHKSLFKEIDCNKFETKNVSFKLNNALQVNGFDEAFDGGEYGYEDKSFFNTLVEKINFKCMSDENNKVIIFNTKSIIPEPRTFRSKELNKIILDERSENNYKSPINNFNLASLRKSIHYKKPHISIIIPTNRIGGLDVLFAGLANQTFKDFELILVDAVYNARKDIVKEKSKLYDFKVKHIEPIDNTFPVSNYCKSINTGLINAEGKLVYFTCDYAYLHKDTLLNHYQFHRNTPKTYGFLMGIDICEFDHDKLLNTFRAQRQYGTKGLDKDYKLLLVPEEQYKSAHNKWSDDYAEDIKDGKLNDALWSIFNNELMSLNDVITTISPDTKFDSLSSEIPAQVIPELCCLKNDSFKLDILMEVNGMSEDLDLSHGFQDTSLARKLTMFHNYKFYALRGTPIHVINTRYFLEPRKVIDAYKNFDLVQWPNIKPNTNNVITKFKENII